MFDAQYKRNPTDGDIVERLDLMGTDHKSFSDMASSMGIGKITEGMDGLPSTFSWITRAYMCA